MMRKILFAAAFFATPAMADETRQFDMFRLNTTDHFSGNLNVAGEPCKLKGLGVERCIKDVDAVIGNESVVNLRAGFNEGRFFRISGEASVIRWEGLRAAFVAKYGQPTSIDHTPWQNAMGATLDNEVARWEFSDGTLEFIKRTTADFSEFRFVANRNLPDFLIEKKPAVNF